MGRDVQVVLCCVGQKTWTETLPHNDEMKLKSRKPLLRTGEGDNGLMRAA